MPETQPLPADIVCAATNLVDIGLIISTIDGNSVVLPCVPGLDNNQTVEVVMSAASNCIAVNGMVLTQGSETIEHQRLGPHDIPAYVWTDPSLLDF